MNQGVLALVDVGTVGRTWTANGTSVAEDAFAPIRLAGVAGLMIAGGPGSDTFNVSPSTSTSLAIIGRAPGRTTVPGDHLAISTPTGVTQGLQITSNDEFGLSGSYNFTGGYQPIPFSAIESGIFAPPVIRTAFGASSIPLRGFTTLSFTLSHSTSPTVVTGLTGLTGVGFSDNLGALGLTATTYASNTCGGTLSGTTMLSLSGGVVPMNGSCTIVVNLWGTKAGPKANTTSPISAFESGPGLTSNTASLNVTLDMTISPSKVIYGNNALVTVKMAASDFLANGSVGLTITPPGNTITQTVTSRSTALNLGVLQAGTYALTAAFSGYSGTDTVSGTLTVVASQVTLSSAPNPSALGQPVTFTAEVGSNDGVPTGTVQFFDGARLLGSAPISAGKAVYTTSALGGGTHSMSAQYSGDDSFPGAASPVHQHRVTATVSMAAEATPAAPGYGQKVMFTAHVSAAAPAGFAAPTGQVSFELAATNLFGQNIPLGVAPLQSGTATLSVVSLPAGALNRIKVSYLGDNIWEPNSVQISVPVAGAATTSTLSLALDAEGRVVLTVGVNSTVSGSGTPTGTVRFLDTLEGTVVATSRLVSGGATTTLLPDDVIGRSIAAAYDGDANFGSSTSALIPVPVSAVGVTSKTFAPDQTVSVYNVTGISGDTPATLPLTTTLAGVTVTITDSAGSAGPSMLYGIFGSACQVNLVIPGNVAAGLALLNIKVPGQPDQNTILRIGRTSPGIFTANVDGKGVYAGQVVYAHADGSRTVGESAIFDSSQNRFVPKTITRGAAGDRVFLILYGTGLRHAASVTATVNGVTAQTILAAQPQYPGLDQINLELPSNLSGAGAVDIVVTADGHAANTVTAVIQ